jgi:5-methylphenazine-1-carboxylate 1-monooxygenase
MRIAIIGGGTSGMTVASSLLDTAIDDVGIYESATAVKELGVGINILPHAVREMTELGLLDALYGVGIPTAEHVFYSSSTTSSCQLIAA